VLWAWIFRKAIVRSPVMAVGSARASSRQPLVGSSTLSDRSQAWAPSRVKVAKFCRISVVTPLLVVGESICERSSDTP
jgi:hypothetical protein